MNSSKKKFSITILIAVFIAVVRVPISGNIEGDHDYFTRKSLGDYIGALRSVVQQTCSLRDPLLIDANIFRIKELMVHSGLYKEGLASCGRIRSVSPGVRGNRYLLGRLGLLENDILWKTGKTAASLTVRDSLGFFSHFMMTGPFENSGLSDFNAVLPPEKEISEGAVYRGKLCEMPWFRTSADVRGIVDMDEIFESTEDSLFYLLTAFRVPEAGSYILHLGRSGYTDIFIDGKKVYSGRELHSFGRDQYRIGVRLSAGIHRILIKTGSHERGGIKISLRMTDHNDVPVSLRAEHPLASFTGTALGTEVSFFSSLKVLQEKKSLSEGDNFRLGYFFLQSGLHNDRERQGIGFFNASKDSTLYGSPSEYYCGLIEKKWGAKDLHYRKSLLLNPRSIEALEKAVELRLIRNRLYEAQPLINRIREIDPDAPFYYYLQGKLLLRKRWYHQAGKLSESIPSPCYREKSVYLKAHAAMKLEQYRMAAEQFGKLFRRERTSREVLEHYVTCLEKSGRYEEAMEVLSHSLATFPNSTRIRLRLSSLSGITKGDRTRLPFLSSILNMSPCHNSAILQTGIVYHKLGNDLLAKYYLHRSMGIDPKNFSLKRYLAVIDPVDVPLEQYLEKRDPEQLALEGNEFRDESAVYLLNETAYRVFDEGSYEKRVHQVVAVNDESAVNTFSQFSVVLDPSTDRLENLECSVINGNEKVDTSEYVTRSLSDPESRLYYNLMAFVVRVPSVRKGSVIQFRYRITSRSGEIYKNYFGARVFAGSSYRTVHSNTVISVPEQKKIYFHLTGFKNGEVKKSAMSGRLIYRVAVKNIEPYLKESAMPHYSEILPTVYCTTHRTWNELYTWYSQMLRDRIVMSEEMTRDLAAVISPGDSDTEKVRKIFNHVTSTIRYVGFELGIGSIQPRRSDETYHSKMGDCKDISLVLTAMLRAAGIDAAIALVRTAASGMADTSFPFLGIFNHAICYVNIGGGFFLDGTARFSGFREIPDSDHGVTAFVVDGNGYRFIPVESRLFAQNSLTISNTVKIMDDRGAVIKRTFFKEGGLFAPSTRHSLMDRGRLKTTISEYWNNSFTGSIIEDLTVLNSAKDNPVSYSYTIKAPNFVQHENGQIMFRAFMQDSGVYKNYAIRKSRNFPIIMSTGYRVREHIDYSIPRGYTVYRMPETGSYVHKKFAARYSYEKIDEGNTIRVTGEISYLAKRIPVEDYPAFREFAGFIQKKENEMIILVKKDQ
ncbi:MAG TPA: DUF3857 domain-containing protein [Spirochaetota bacterium]|nr:DUF3857 domain-containing protein [Spirochaetota bacterium]